ncbi:Sulfite exporter TauE/SafE [Phytophthora infestans]|uniref:Sulfite exporter TauE/SafE n=1 Tax=Phytophthora infestans TaxID=4787 RepID=A0A833RU80_PHYIN|nr:Sulfite exporter TauE/SafE [Phytophthora infestans]KAF4133795.1 Sulfite exporter TauE/SafE [Phytophthora infestans]
MSVSPASCCRLHPILFVCVLLALVTTVVADDGESSTSDGDSVPSLSEMDTYNVLAIVFMIIGLAVSSAGGIGGGVILVQSMVPILGFDIKRATPISNVAILGSAVTNTWFNMLALGMIPVVIGGTVLGAVINKLIPSYIVSLLFVVVLGVSDVRMTLREIRLVKKEVAL